MYSFVQISHCINQAIKLLKVTLSFAALRRVITRVTRFASCLLKRQPCRPRRKNLPGIVKARSANTKLIFHVAANDTLRKRLYTMIYNKYPLELFGMEALTAAGQRYYDPLPRRRLCQSLLDPFYRPRWSTVYFTGMIIKIRTRKYECQNRLCNERCNNKRAAT